MENKGIFIGVGVGVGVGGGLLLFLVLWRKKEFLEIIECLGN